MPSDRTTRRSVLRLTAGALGGVGAVSGTALACHGCRPPGTPPAVSTLAPSVGSNSVTLVGSLDAVGSADCTDVWFEWGPASTGLQVASGHRTGHSPGVFGETVSGLSGQYVYRAVAANGCGDDAGDVFFFSV